MLLRPLALAAIAAAFIIVPEMSENDENIFKALPIQSHGSAFPFGTPKSAFDQSISVPCRGCRGRHTQLRLDFTIEDEKKLLLNGFELYPETDPWGADLQATVVNGHRRPRSKKLGYSLAVYPKAIAEEDKMELIEVDLKIIEVGTRFVDGVPTVKVELIKTPGGNLAMSTVAFDHPVESPCDTIWCRAKELADKLWVQAHRIKNCGKAVVPEPGSEAEPMPPSYSDLHDAGDIKVTEPTITSKKEWRHLMKSVLGHIIMPIFMGVTAGVAIAFLALCIQSIAGRFISFVRGKRRSDRRDESHKATYNEQATSEEKVQLMA
ncbi:hypothetical protein A9K55_005606 [Cordyceps militaris]|uniref:DUF7728 domain-containing protein n=1 Tax=Cordyceps militaris TaxID=73501 RepID=A0A2H4SD67_CORMI|nr:hypothetical protein A9K55_005606 [Cordyceps militaris]